MVLRIHQSGTALHCAAQGVRFTSTQNVLGARRPLVVGRSWRWCASRRRCVHGPPTALAVVAVAGTHDLACAADVLRRAFRAGVARVLTVVSSSTTSTRMTWLVSMSSMASFIAEVSSGHTISRLLRCGISCASAAQQALARERLFGFVLWRAGSSVSRGCGRCPANVGAHGPRVLSSPACSIPDLFPGRLPTVMCRG